MSTIVSTLLLEIKNQRFYAVFSQVQHDVTDLELAVGQPCISGRFRHSVKRPILRVVSVHLIKSF